MSRFALFFTGLGDGNVEFLCMIRRYFFARVFGVVML